jgi:hypothetical protein
METVKTNKFKILSGSVLKLIAIITMTIDHTAVTFQQDFQAIDIPFVEGSVLGGELTLYWLMRLIGRVAFPIFCFLIGEGYRHTRNKPKYALRLLIFAVISEIPYNLLHGHWFASEAQNVFVTLFLGLMMIHAFETIKGNLLKYVVMLAIATISTYLKADYDLTGVLLVFIIYILRNHPAAQAILSYPLLNIGPAALMAFIPINLYNGKRGFIKAPVLKFFFYAFYPLHILILVGIRYLIK